MFEKPLWQTVWTIGAFCSGSTLFASILNSSVKLGNYLQQTTSVDDIFRCILLLALKGYNINGAEFYCIYSPISSISIEYHFCEATQQVLFYDCWPITW